MSQFTHIIFDLDGTLTDNTRGIGNSIKYALTQMHIEGYSEETLKQFIGPPLQWGFSNLFGMNERNTKLAVEYFREYFGEKGLYENEPYPGVEEMLQELDTHGKKLYIATSKLEKFALKVVAHFGFDKYVLQTYGADYSGQKGSKSDIVSFLLNSQQLVPSEKIVMVGDTVFDIEGGKANGLSTVAVNYGFGMEEKLRAANPDFWADDVDELFEILN